MALPEFRIQVGGQLFRNFPADQTRSIPINRDSYCKAPMKDSARRDKAFYVPVPKHWWGHAASRKYVWFCQLPLTFAVLIALKKASKQSPPLGRLGRLALILGIRNGVCSSTADKSQGEREVCVMSVSKVLWLEYLEVVLAKWLKQRDLSPLPKRGCNFVLLRDSPQRQRQVETPTPLVVEVSTLRSRVYLEAVSSSVDATVASPVFPKTHEW